MNRVTKLLFLIITFSCLQLKANDVKVISFDEFQAMTERNNDTTYIYNFWATFCVPCIKEVPDFEKINSTYINSKVKVIFISLDFSRDLNSRVKPFIAKHNIKSEVYLLGDHDYNSWIDKVDKSWSGGIPATLIINHNKNIRKFYEQEFTFNDLNAVVNQIINQ